ncbi:MAG: hypothetical protein WBB45_08180 [Cyclobacteriaceae bacterium]
MIQEIAVFIIFSLALFYLVRTFFASAPGQNDSACGTACKGCGAVDFKAIEKEMKKQEKAKAHA